MPLWTLWYSMVAPLSKACSRQRSFLWLVTALAGFSIRADLFGVTSFIRALGLAGRYYRLLLEHFYSRAVDLEALTRLWVQQVLTHFPVYRIAGRIVLLADGLKGPKSGRKMPGVKGLHQESSDNTKPPFILGHSLQVVSLLAYAAGGYFAVPLSARIHEGVKLTPRDQRTLPEKLCTLIEALALAGSYILIADAYYACQAVLRWALAAGHTVISRVRNTVVAYAPVPPADPSAPKRRGRPRVYGEKIKLITLFDSSDEWQSAASPVYGEQEVTIRYRCVDLLWRPVRRRLRFVLVEHPTRGRCILFSSDLALTPLEIIGGYGLRYKIELAFKQALHVVGTCSYHFWLRSMDKLSRKGLTQFLHRKPKAYREAVKRKLAAYHRHIQLGLIAQGLLQYLSLTASRLVWAAFGSWLRTSNQELPPSEWVTAVALRHALPEFLVDDAQASEFKKFLRERIDPAHAPPWRLAA